MVIGLDLTTQTALGYLYPMMTYFKGDRAIYTGKVMQLHGATFYEIKMLEGHMAGQLKVVRAAPQEAK